MLLRPRLLEKAAANTMHYEFSKSNLARLRLRAVRSGAWFRALRRIDRVLVNVTLKVSTRIQSAVLSSALTAIANRLEEALRNKMEVATQRYGVKLAIRVSLIAQRLGNKSSHNWATDPSFARFLAVIHINAQDAFRP